MTSPAFSFYAKDWLAATMTWPLEARGAYMTLLAYQWDAGHIPAGHDQLARLLGVSLSKARKIWTVIAPKFHYDLELGWQNLRLEDERRKQQEYRADKAGAGKRGAANRWHTHPKTHGKRMAHPSENTWQNDGSSSSSSSSSSEFPPNPPQTGGVKVRREHREHAKAVLKAQLGYCQHDPECPNQVACTERLALELAEKGLAS